MKLLLRRIFSSRRPHRFTCLATPRVGAGLSDAAYLLIADETEKWGKVVRTGGLKPE